MGEMEMPLSENTVPGMGGQGPTGSAGRERPQSLPAARAAGNAETTYASRPSVAGITGIIKADL